MIEKIIDTIDKTESNLKKVISFLTVCSTLIGGIILLKYSFDIKYIPINFSLSNIFSLIIFSLIFGIFSLFLFFCFWLSSGLIGYFLNILILSIFKIKNFKKLNIIKNILSITNRYKLAKIDLILNLFLAVFIFMVFYISKIFNISDFFLINAILLFLRFFYIGIKNEILKNSLENKNYNKDEHSKKFFIIYSFVILLVASFIILPKLNLIVHIMNIANVRSYDVDIHIKNPYYAQFQECNIPLKSSSFGDNYKKVEQVNIDLQNVDKNIVVNLKNKDNAICERVIISKLDDNIFVVKKREVQ